MWPLVVVLLAMPSQEDDKPWPWQGPGCYFNLYYENDHGTDQNYTGGLQTDLGLYCGYFGQVKLGVGLTHGFSLWTPENRVFPGVITDDRPYASWHYAGLTLQLAAFEESRGAYRPWLWIGGELTFGELGNEPIQDFQNFLHENISNSPRVVGWDNGLGIAKQNVFQGSIEVMGRVPVSDGRIWDLWLLGGVDHGVLGRARAGAMARVGWNLDCAGIWSVTPHYINDNAVQPSVAAFFGGESRVVWENKTLKDDTGRSPHTIEIENLTYKVEGGVRVGYRRFFISLGRVVLWPEFEDQEDRYSTHGYWRAITGWTL